MSLLLQFIGPGKLVISAQIQGFFDTLTLSCEEGRQKVRLKLFIWLRWGIIIKNKIFSQLSLLNNGSREKKHYYYY